MIYNLSVKNAVLSIMVLSNISLRYSASDLLLYGQVFMRRVVGCSHMFGLFGRHGVS